MLLNVNNPTIKVLNATFENVVENDSIILVLTGDIFMLLFSEIIDVVITLTRSNGIKVHPTYDFGVFLDYCMVDFAII